ncbi:MAG TPA: PAS domain S-box protein [Desulfobacteraceae bacterium]|nr:PAS domain S-box protein [Desulfobacteraceae bacterium]HPJ68557.1 PAS domain S-box protein [Desulfobacteraceae bacterium]HPQ28681.1 PAS domain S-box protein [Desulfobacteraceae bacterium]
MPEKPTYQELEKRVRDLEAEAKKHKSVEQALRESEQKFSQIVNGNSIPTLVIDIDHITTHCNKAYEFLTGISASEIIGTQNQWVAFYPEQRPILADFIVDRTPVEEVEKYYRGKLKKFALKDGAFQAEVFFPDKGETGKWFFFTAAPLIDAKGNITGSVETFQDLTKRKKAEEAVRKSEIRYRTLLDFVPYPVAVFTIDGRVTYINSEFTTVFGWTFDELEGKTIPFIPPELKRETVENVRRLFKEKTLLSHETQRLTKDGRLLDVSVKAAYYAESEIETSGMISILRDISKEKRLSRINEAILRISMALPEYPSLDDLLFYINGEVNRLLNTEASIVILLDEAKNELYFVGAVYEDTATQSRASNLRFPADAGVAAKVLKTGEPVIVTDTSKDPDFYAKVDSQLGFHSRNMLDLPLRTYEKIRGVLCAINKKQGYFNQDDVDLLTMIEGTVALSVENARVNEELKNSYEEVKSLNRAKDKVINHLSHELKTPVAVLSGSLDLLMKKLGDLSEKNWKPNVEMAKRNVDRIREIQYEVEDIMLNREFRSYGLLSLLLDQCQDELEVLIEEEGKSTIVIERIRKKIQELFGPKELDSKIIHLDEFLKERLEFLKPYFAHRQVEIITVIDTPPPFSMPPDVMNKVIDCLVKNAIENTPDEGKIEIIVRKKGEGSELVVHDYGIGISEEAQKRIFEGFFVTQQTMSYSSKTPFDFNAGGKGADLLRTRIFSERYNFEIHMESSKCGFIPKDDDICPGRISACSFCKEKDDCYNSGETVFSLYFPPAS